MANSRTLEDLLFLCVYQKLKWILDLHIQFPKQIPTHFIKINYKISVISIQKTKLSFCGTKGSLKNSVKFSQFMTSKGNETPDSDFRRNLQRNN